jgi:hypothetical protein
MSYSAKVGATTEISASAKMSAATAAGQGNITQGE